MTETMTLSEFKKAIDEWGKSWGIETEVKKENVCTFVFAKRRNSEKICVARIFNDDVCVMDMNANSLELRHTMRRPLFEIVTKFANTWPADRKDEEKKYLLKHRFVKSYNNPTFLAGSSEYFWLSAYSDVDCKNKQFTLEEIEDLKMLYDTDLKDFELIEVEEDVEKN